MAQRINYDVCESATELILVAVCKNRRIGKSKHNLNVLFFLDALNCTQTVIKYFPDICYCKIQNEPVRVNF